jgi:CRP-like cAMP-binding protein
MDVVAAAEGALVGAGIPNVSTDPAPQCLLMELGESWGRYAVRYWLTDLAVDDPTDHVVRTRVVMALARAGIQLAMPAASLFVSQSAERDAKHAERRRQRALDAISHTELFAHLPEEDRCQLADGLRLAPFARGEIITRQGAEAHWLYIVVEGQVSVRVAVEGGLEREVKKIGPGQFFGEMSLMTGSPRLATVVALTDVQCYRLDSHVFADVIHRRPALAEEVADVLAHRRVELVAVRDNLSQEAASHRLVQTRTDIVARIRSFFRLPDERRS